MAPLEDDRKKPLLINILLVNTMEHFLNEQGLCEDLEQELLEYLVMVERLPVSDKTDHIRHQEEQMYDYTEPCEMTRIRCPAEKEKGYDEEPKFDDDANPGKGKSKGNGESLLHLCGEQRHFARERSAAEGKGNGHDCFPRQHWAQNNLGFIPMAVGLLATRWCVQRWAGKFVQLPAAGLRELCTKLAWRWERSWSLVTAASAS